METVTYLLQPKPSDKAQQGPRRGRRERRGPGRRRPTTDDDQNQKTDFLIDFARDLLAQAKSIRRRDLVQAAKAFLDKVRAAEDKKVSQALEKLGVDWTAGPTTGALPELQLTLQPTTGDAKIAAGTVAEAARRGEERRAVRRPTACARCSRATTRSSTRTRWCSARSRPGESKSYELSVKVPTSSFTRTDEIKATLYTQRGDASRRRRRRPARQHRGEGPRPMFAYTYQTIDDQKGGNHDGQVQRGEQVRMLVTVKNIGQGQGAPHRGGAAQRDGPGGDPDQRGPLRGQGPRPRRDQDLLVRLRGAAGLQGGRLPARARGRRHDARRIGDRQDQGQDRPGGPGARAAVRGPRPSFATTCRCARRSATARWSWGGRPRGPRSRPAASSAPSRASTSTGRGSAFVATADLKSGRQRPRHAVPRVAGDAAAADGDGADRRDGRHRPHRGARRRRSPGPRRLRAGLEPQREDPGEEGLLPAEPPHGRPDEDGLRGRHPALGRAATWCRSSRANRTRCSRCRRWSCSGGRRARASSRSRPIRRPPPGPRPST